MQILYLKTVPFDKSIAHTPDSFNTNEVICVGFANVKGTVLLTPCMQGVRRTVPLTPRSYSTQNNSSNVLSRTLQILIHRLMVGL